MLCQENTQFDTKATLMADVQRHSLAPEAPERMKSLEILMPKAPESPHLLVCRLPPANGVEDR